MKIINFEMLAYDIADMLQRNEYPIDVADKHIVGALPAFVESITLAANAETARTLLVERMPESYSTDEVDDMDDAEAIQFAVSCGLMEA